MCTVKKEQKIEKFKFWILFQDIAKIPTELISMGFKQQLVNFLYNIFSGVGGLSVDNWIKATYICLQWNNENNNK